MTHNTYQQPHNHTHSFSKRRLYGVACVAVTILFTFLTSCKPDDIQDGTKPKYFDLAGYFKADTAKLHKRNPVILKTVKHNGVTETKKLHIDDWGLELGLFIQSDINKPAWRNSYSIQEGSDGTTIYMAKDPDLKTRLVTITRKKDKSIKWILIVNATKNTLYETTEYLRYIPDSLYSISKSQHVRLLSTNKYLITGTLN